ncbi:hypothetical protein CEXT_168221 [Caerostris extrusa]|uniref:Uncharacterized protein n=1 Tax=Caerostris extrusa TaxID=172846 RepID=A0AAV4Q9T5_CAEEX|nr:hypothetical protein CEXT_168221 [Caerostris extrusa]
MFFLSPCYNVKETGSTLETWLDGLHTQNPKAGAPMEKPVSHRQPREVHSGLVSLGGGSERRTVGARLVTRGSGSTPAQSSLSSLGTFKNPSSQNSFR